MLDLKYLEHTFGNNLLKGVDFFNNAGRDDDEKKQPVIIIVSIKCKEGIEGWVNWTKNENG